MSTAIPYPGSYFYPAEDESQAPTLDQIEEKAGEVFLDSSETRQILKQWSDGNYSDRELVTMLMMEVRRCTAMVEKNPEEFFE